MLELLHPISDVHGPVHWLMGRHQRQSLSSSLQAAPDTGFCMSSGGSPFASCAACVESHVSSSHGHHAGLHSRHIVQLAAGSMCGLCLPPPSVAVLQPRSGRQLLPVFDSFSHLIELFTSLAEACTVLDHPSKGEWGPRGPHSGGALRSLPTRLMTFEQMALPAAHGVAAWPPCSVSGTAHYQQPHSG